MSDAWRAEEFGDTPRTAAEAWHYCDDETPDGRRDAAWRAVYLVSASFAAQLERDLTAARARIAELEEALRRVVKQRKAHGYTSVNKRADDMAEIASRVLERRSAEEQQR